MCARTCVCMCVRARQERALLLACPEGPGHVLRERGCSQPYSSGAPRSLVLLVGGVPGGAAEGLRGPGAAVVFWSREVGLGGEQVVEVWWNSGDSGVPEVISCHPPPSLQGPEWLKRPS